MSREKISFTLENVGHDTLETFTRACSYGGSSRNIEILSVSEIDIQEGIIKKGYNIELLASPEDLFWIGRFFERLNDMRTINLMRFKKTVKVKVPEQLIKLCELIEVAPEIVLQSFANDVSLSVHCSSGSDERRMAVDYFKRAGHGMHLFDYEEIENMFDGLEWIRYEWRSYGNTNENEYKIFFKRELKEWFTKWNAAKAEKAVRK